MRPRALGRRLSLLLLAALAVIGMWVVLDHPSGMPLTYEQFLGEVRAGRVDAVQQHGSLLAVSLENEQALVTAPPGVDVSADIAAALGPRPAKAIGVGAYAGGTDVMVVVAGLLPLFLVVGLATWVQAVALLMQPDEVIGQMGERAITYSIVRRDAFLAPDGHELPHDQGIPTTGGGSAGPDGVRWVGIGVAGTRYPAVETALVSLQGLVGLGGVLATVVVVRRRRPL